MLGKTASGVPWDGECENRCTWGSSEDVGWWVAGEKWGVCGGECLDLAGAGGRVADEDERRAKKGESRVKKGERRVKKDERSACPKQEGG